jgi:general secretion pathway protein N
MARRGAYIAAGVVAFLVFLVAMVPAGQLARRLPPGIAIEGAGGTVWSGRARSLAVEGRSLGRVEWSCKPWRLLLLEWSCRLALHPAGGEVTGDLSGDFGTEILAHDVQGSVPISAFEGIATPRGWSGTLELALGEVTLVDRRPVAATGTLHLRSLHPPGARSQPLGDFELVVGEGSVGGESLSGRLRDLGGPLHVRGAIELDRDGRYLLRGDAAPGPGAGPAIFDALGFLGAPDSQGRRPFTIEGTL